MVTNNYLSKIYDDHEFLHRSALHCFKFYKNYSSADGLSTSLGEQTGDGLMQCRQTLSDSVWYLAYIYGICIFVDYRNNRGLHVPFML